jgi:hypothetical protein
MIFQALSSDFVVLYLDGIMIYFENLKAHSEHVQKVSTARTQAIRQAQQMRTCSD